MFVQTGRLKRENKAWVVHPDSFETIPLAFDPNRNRMPAKVVDERRIVFYLEPFFFRQLSKQEPQIGSRVIFERTGPQITAWNYC
ncbi:hypothetical protein HYS03_02790 [Candidatus Woesebacteria bacterium]|nr:hypothetical protein [Candidatus Woesebacteria bacterium]QQG47235.1 MAG: hypothetical protein HY044_03860 [Candidatus Woesebacteria bacterium]